METTLLGRVGHYFDLRLPRQPQARAAGPIEMEWKWSGQDVLWVAVVYATQLLGVVAKQVYDDLSAGRQITFPVVTLAMAAIVSAASFPAIYSRLQEQTNPALRLFLAFESGFFWRSLFAGSI